MKMAGSLRHGFRTVAGAAAVALLPCTLQAAPAAVGLPDRDSTVEAYAYVSFHPKSAPREALVFQAPGGPYAGSRFVVHVGYADAPHRDGPGGLLIRVGSWAGKAGGVPEQITPTFTVSEIVSPDGTVTHPVGVRGRIDDRDCTVGDTGFPQVCRIAIIGLPPR